VRGGSCYWGHESGSSICIIGKSKEEKAKESWITTSVREAETKSKLQATQSHILESDESKAHNEQEGPGKT
jgi:hypothetical protein